MKVRGNIVFLSVLYREAAAASLTEEGEVCRRGGFQDGSLSGGESSVPGPLMQPGTIVSGAQAENKSHGNLCENLYENLFGILLN